MKLDDGSGTFLKVDAASLRWPSRVMVASPEARMRDVMASAFLDEGFEVAETNTGSAALEYLGLVAQCRFRKPDVIILSLWLKDCSALRVARAIREAAWTTPVLVLGQVPAPLLRELGNTRAIRRDLHVDEVRVAVIEAHLSEARVA